MMHHLYIHKKLSGPIKITAGIRPITEKSRTIVELQPGIQLCQNNIFTAP